MQTNELILYALDFLKANLDAVDSDREEDGLPPITEYEIELAKMKIE